jgi:hypothetical protein
VKILDVIPNNRKKAFTIRAEDAEYDFPYAKLEFKPLPDDRVVEAYPDEEAGREAFTYRLESGAEDTVHVDAVLEYNQDPGYLNEVLLHRLTVEAKKAVEESDLSKRELVRRLETSASQLYRLLDPTYMNKSVGQMLALLRLLGREVDLVVRPIRRSSSRKRQRKVAF